MTTTDAPKTSYVRNFQPRTKEDQREIWYTQFPVDAVWGIYARQSSPAQVKNNTQSTEMQTDELIQWLLDRKVSQERIFLFDADLGKSGTKRIDERSALEELVERIIADEIK